MHIDSNGEILDGEINTRENMPKISIPWGSPMGPLKLKNT